MSITIRAEHLPAPTKVYQCSAAGVQLANGKVTFVFGEAWAGEPRLSSVVQVLMSVEGVKKAFVESNPAFAVDIRAMTKGRTEPLLLPSADTYPLDAQRRATEHAAILTLAASEHGASMRFYRFSPNALHYRTADADLVVPGIEIVLTTELLVGLSARVFELLSAGG